MDVLKTFFQEHFCEIIFITIGCLLLLYSLKNLIITLGSVNWESTIGIIDDSYFEYDHEADQYVVKLEFSYVVDGEKYCSRRIYPSAESVMESKKRAEAMLYSIGQEVKIYYNPQNCKEACLHINKGYEYIIPVAFIGIVSIIIGILVYMEKIVLIMN